MISCCTASPDSKNTKLGISHQEASPSGKNTRVDTSMQLFLVVWIFLRFLGVICYDRWFFSEGHKNYFKYWCLIKTRPTFLFSTSLNSMNYGHIIILSKACKPDNFESHYSLKPSFANIRGLHSNFVDCESFLESNFSYILALCETNLDDLINSGNFSVKSYLPLNWKDSSTHMHGLAVYVKEGLPFSWDSSLANSADSYLSFQLALLHSVSYFFFLYQSPSSSMCTVFNCISSNIDEVLSSNPFLMSIIRPGLPLLVERPYSDG